MYGMYGEYNLSPTPIEIIELADMLRSASLTRPPPPHSYT